MNTALQISKRLIFVMVILFSQAILASYPIPNEKDVISTFGFSSQDSFFGRLNILVWNLHKGEDTTFATDFVALAYHKDLVISQEMYLTSSMKAVFNSFPYYFYATATSFFYGKDHLRTGVATSSPVPPSAIDFVRTETLEPFANSPKIALITQYPIRFSNKQLTVVNIHGINFVDNTSYRKEMKRLVEVINKIPGPLIFAGDFNSWNDERDLILKEMEQKLRLSEAKFSPDFRITFNKHHLDHFYFTDDIKIISAKAEDFYAGSDHKPLELVIEYSPKINSMEAQVEQSQ